MHAIDRDSAPEKPCADVALVPRGMVWRRPPARRALLAGVLAALMAVSAQAQELIPPTASGWNAFAPRGETAPGMDVSLGAGGYSLNIYGNGVPSVYGGWKTRIEGLQGLSYFRFRARALPLNIGSLRESVTNPPPVDGLVWKRSGA